MGFDSCVLLKMFWKSIRILSAMLSRKRKMRAEAHRLGGPLPNLPALICVPFTIGSVPSRSNRTGGCIQLREVYVSTPAMSRKIQGGDILLRI